MFGRKKNDDNLMRETFNADKFLKLLKQEGYELTKNEFGRYYVSQSVLLDEVLDGKFSEELSEDVIKPGFFSSKKVDFLGIQNYEELDYILDLYNNHLYNENLEAIYSVILNNFDNLNLVKNAKVIAYYKNFVENEQISLKDVISNLAEKENANEISLTDFYRFSAQNDYTPSSNYNEEESQELDEETQEVDEKEKAKKSVNEYYHNFKGQNKNKDLEEPLAR